MVQLHLLDKKIIILILIFSGFIYSYFELDSYGGYSTALANSNITDRDNYYFYLNPASSSDIPDAAVTMTYRNLYTGLSAKYYDNYTDHFRSGYLSYIYPLSSAEYMPANKTVNYYTVGAGYTFFNTSLYSENKYIFNFSKTIFQKFVVGSNLTISKYSFTRNIYTELNPDLQNKRLSKLSYNIDFGGIYKINKTFNTALVIKNVIPTNISFLGNINKSIQRFEFGGEYNITFSKKIDSKFYLSTELSTYNTNNEFDKNIMIGNKNSFYLFGNNCFTYLGVDRNNFNTGFGLIYKNIYLNMTFRIDYVFSYQFHIHNNMGHHSISFIVI